ncbi:prolyl oligopeptidase [Fistulifera solaris]|uniref:Prolyl endopeptidase n=1 Tax=Fistulifera solaris TaxID=1519565 RepID=A0A1Z5KF08_FISSO|nr:prolyl oligopeptidase [Fistulifera solaris]|eukprot:GAX24904.1 prolyl oligopeptidase [Fistulifera solaris]
MSTVSTEDPYIWLEEVESEQSLDFARSANAACLAALGNPEGKGTYARVLKILESDDRIPHVTHFGVNDDGEPILFNFWKDGKNPKGLWRYTTLSSYKKTSDIEWTTVLDVDALAEKDGISWVWGGSRPLPRSRDPVYSKDRVTRALIVLSRGGSDATHVKEFDLTTNEFVTDQPFQLSEAKSRVSYKSRNVLLVGTDTGPDSLTDSGYPRTVREWVRGTDLLTDAKVVFEGEKTDVSVSAFISDERIWGGGIYEVYSRAMTFYTSKYFVRSVQFEHLLAPDERGPDVSDPPDFVELDVQDDANISFLGKLLVITLRSDWEPVAGGPVYKKGSVIYTDAETFLQKGRSGCEYKILFEPTERTAYEYYAVTKNYLILSTMDNVKSRLRFYKIEDGGSRLTLIEGGSQEAQIRDVGIRPIDPYSGSDEFWFTTSDFVTPSTLFLADASRMERTNGESDAFIVEQVKSLPPQFDASGLVVSQCTATSKDGTHVPYFIVRKEDTVLNGKNPTLLYGYGGFEVSLGPHYVATQGVTWLERGGVYVEANIRGGGEFGPSWHQAGLKANRNKCYEDFIAVGEHLIETNVCRPKTLAVRGGSNGGLLVGNMYTMRPDLFGAIHCAVPLLDMKRFHTLLAGASWMAEYGNPDTDDWEFLQKYSPYHNIKEGTEYPPILVTTSTRDDRVHPAHARKFVKKLIDVSNGKLPVYYYENIEGGHGGAADAKQSAFMTALAYDFMFDTLSKNAMDV